jgi:hypothetical protein
MGGLVYDAVRPEAGPTSAALGTLIFVQIIVFTYPFWIVEYRRVQSWKYAAGICLGMRPRNLLEGVDLPLWRAALLRLIYAGVTAAGLLCPIRVYSSSVTAAELMWANRSNKPAKTSSRSI